MLRDMKVHSALRFPDQGSGAYRLLRAGADRLIRRFHDALTDPAAAQEARLQVILRNARGTAFGDAHRLGAVKSLEDFRSAVPIRDHQGHLPWLQRVAAGESAVLTRERPQMLLETSGTSGVPKHLPVTTTWARGVADAQRLWVLAMLRDHPRVADGAALTIVSPAEHGRSAGGLPIGSNTGRMHLAQPWWIRARYPVPYRVFEIDDPDVRTYSLLRFALQARLRTITTANPSTLLLLARRLEAWREPLSRDLRDGRLQSGPAASLPAATRRALRWRLRRCRPDGLADRPTVDLACVNCWRGPRGLLHVPSSGGVGADVPLREVGITASEGYFAIPFGPSLEAGSCGPSDTSWNSSVTMGVLDGDGNWTWRAGASHRHDRGGPVSLRPEGHAGGGRSGGGSVFRFVGKTGRYLNATGEKVTRAMSPRRSGMRPRNWG